MVEGDAPATASAITASRKPGRLSTVAGFSDISIEEETAPATFESSRLYVDVLVEGGAAVIPALAEMTLDDRAKARAQLHRDVAASLSEFETGGVFRFPFTTHIAVATAS